MTREIEVAIAALNRSLGSFCGQLQTSVDALRQSVDRRPIPLDSASSSFIQRLTHRLTSTSVELELLESMSFGTVSFEELLGHCNEVLKKNDADISHVVDSLRSSGYLPSEVDIDGECSLDWESASSGLDSFVPNRTDGLQDVSPFPAFNSFEDDPLLDDSMTLKKLGISEASLASIASTGTPFTVKGKAGEPEFSLNTTRTYTEQTVSNVWGTSQYSMGNTAINEGGKLSATEDDPIPKPNAKAVQVSVDDYECLPSYMRSLASWEDLHSAVGKISLRLDQKENNYFLPDEISSLDLGPKTRSYLLLLVRMNKLVVETIDGLVAYRAI
ncbi:hypothetical protein MLD38_021403 [Melastoma candidum]|uniref:Uncharacterized protein n=1 Tax=Melastoma candidum TaxID=119954 RepID=A0ACB9QGX9_9MYRT|nr:hypothetical protein MLD38_021403 [Melastoma candidum]